MLPSIDQSVHFKLIEMHTLTLEPIIRPFRGTLIEAFPSPPVDLLKVHLRRDYDIVARARFIQFVLLCLRAAATL